MESTNYLPATTTKTLRQFDRDIELNEKQRLAIDLVLSGHNVVIIGKAGTGKTTSLRQLVIELLEVISGQCDYRIQGEGTFETGKSIAVVCYTRAAVKQAKQALKGILSIEVTTIHNLLEFRPIYYEDDDGQRTMRFEPARDKYNRLEQDIVIIDEASFLGTKPIWEQFIEAYSGQIVLVGDINQIPPVYGQSVLYYAVNQWKYVYLDQVYRQALGNPIIRQSLQLLEGFSPGQDLIPATTNDPTNTNGDMHGVATIPITKDHGTAWQKSFFRKLILDKKFDPSVDKILSPYNVKEWGVDNVNAVIASLYDELEERVIYHVVTGIKSYYLAVGDYVSWNREQWRIDNIVPNKEFSNPYMKVHAPSTHNSRWGFPQSEIMVHIEDIDLGAFTDIEFGDNKTVDEKELEKRMPKECSHEIHLTLAETGEGSAFATLHRLADFRDFKLDYARTIHTSQGSQWRRVFVIQHPTQSALRSREMLYTAMTRAQELVVLISDRKTLIKATKNTLLAGRTIDDKIRNLRKQYNVAQLVLPTANTRNIDSKLSTHGHKLSMATTQSVYEEGSGRDLGTYDEFTEAYHASVSDTDRLTRETVSAGNTNKNAYRDERGRLASAETAANFREDNSSIGDAWKSDREFAKAISSERDSQRDSETSEHNTGPANTTPPTIPTTDDWGLGTNERTLDTGNDPVLQGVRPELPTGSGSTGHDQGNDWFNGQTNRTDSGNGKGHSQLAPEARTETRSLQDLLRTRAANKTPGLRASSSTSTNTQPSVQKLRLPATDWGFTKK